VVRAFARINHIKFVDIYDATREEEDELERAQREEIFGPDESDEED